MSNGLFRKGLVLGVIVLFVGIAVIPSTGSNIAVDESSKSITKAPKDIPLLPIMWTEDFSTFNIKILGNTGGDVYYSIIWGDGTSEDWFGPFDSNETISLSHLYDEGNYTINVCVKNPYGGVSNWTTYGLILSSDLKFFYLSIGYAGVPYIFTIYWKVCKSYYISWGDVSGSGWIEPCEIAIITHPWSPAGEYILSLNEKEDIPGNKRDGITLIITILPLENSPPTAPTITGEIDGDVGTEYEYDFMSTDPDLDDIAEYIVNWCDGTGDEIITGPFASGEPASVIHKWTEVGHPTITARAKDVNGLVGPEGAMMVPITRNRQMINPLLLRLLERFPLLERLFNFIL